MAKKTILGRVKIDYALLISFLILIVVGILTIYSAGGDSNQHIRQIYWAITGIVIFVLMLLVNYHRMGEYAFFIYLAGLLMLILVLLIGKRVRGAKSWITVAWGFGFQPSEFVKITVIIALARFLDRVGDDIKSLKNVIIALGICVIPMGLILLQPDFGTALVYLPICMIMLFFAGIKYTHLISLLIIFGIAVVLPLLATFSKLTHSGTLIFLQVLDDTKTVFLIALMFGLFSGIMFILYRITKKSLLYKASTVFLIFFTGLILAAPLGRFLKPYQKERLIVFLRPTIDPFGSGYNIIQSKIAVGAGGLFGRGLLGGTQSQLGFLPERSTDFIFSIYAEAWGFFGSLALLAVYGIFIYRGIMTIYNGRDRFSFLLAAGIMGMFLFHIIINVGMTIGIMPITGIPLPFLSYGGSFLLTCIVAVSILSNIELRRYTH
ncbi:MAG: rod shape-determining protein RodA [Spirochaetes bacterium]|nr:rod shape-determining protein RodA [Spirochaetota bacterium]